MIEAVRDATDADVHDLVRFATAFVEELAPMRGGGLWSLLGAPAPPFDTHFASLTGASGTEADPAPAVVVGTIDGAAVGYAVMHRRTLRDGSHLAEITELYVEPEARSVGIGDTVVEALVTRARAWGCTGIDATALPGHRSTKNFFEGQGFVARSLTMHHALDEPAAQ